MKNTKFRESFSWGGGFAKFHISHSSKHEVCIGSLKINSIKKHWEQALLVYVFNLFGIVIICS